MRSCFFAKGFRETLNAFKAANGLETNGLLDYETYNAIFDKVSYVYAWDHNKDPQLNKAKELIGHE